MIFHEVAEGVDRLIDGYRHSFFAYLWYSNVSIVDVSDCVVSQFFILLCAVLLTKISFCADSNIIISSFNK